MKKLFFAILSAIMLISTISAPVHAADDMVSVTFKLPEGHFYEYISDNVYHRSNSRVLKVEKGHVLTAEDVEPFTHHCESKADCHRFCRVSFLGWDTDPIGMTITEDCTFAAQLNTSVHSVTVTMNKGNYAYPTRVEHDGIQEFEKQYQSFSVLVDDGYALTLQDKEIFTEECSDIYANPFFYIVGFDKSIEGFEVKENTDITAYAKKNCLIDFKIPTADGYQSLYVNAVSGVYVMEGESLNESDLPKFPELPANVAYAYWDVSPEQLKNITDDMEVFAIYIDIGDANCDGRINTADATTILKHAAGIITLDANSSCAADMNHDDNINTGDAVEVLKYLVG